VSDDKLDATSLRAFDALGFCGCGRPDDALLYVRNVLRHVHSLKTDGWPLLEGIGPKPAWDEWIKGHRERGETLFHGDTGAEYLVYYLLADKGLLEHGGSLPGWLTPEGEAILAELEAHSAQLETEAAP
jgi:hypothetical protein